MKLNLCRLIGHKSRDIARQKIGYQGQDWIWAYLVDCKRCDAVWEEIEWNPPGHARRKDPIEWHTSTPWEGKWVELL